MNSRINGALICRKKTTKIQTQPTNKSVIGLYETSIIRTYELRAVPPEQQSDSVSDSEVVNGIIHIQAKGHVQTQ